MKNVLPFKARTHPKDERVDTLKDLMEKEARGELLGHIHIAATADGDSYALHGQFADRLQYAALAMIKTLSEVADKIRDSDTSGYTSSPPMSAPLPTRKRMPEATDFGGLR